MKLSTTAYRNESQRAGAGPRRLVLRLSVTAFALLLLNSAYLFVSNAATLFYLLNVAYHLLAGLGFALLALVVGLRYVVRALESRPPPMRRWLILATLAGAIGIGSGLLLAYTGATRPLLGLLRTHIIACLVSLGAAGLYLRAAVAVRAPEARWWSRTRVFWQLGALVIPGFFLLGFAGANSRAVIRNPLLPPLDAFEEAGGKARNRFFPSSIRTVGNRLMPEEFFTEESSLSCGEAGCHPDIVRQWNESAHHFSSFNNQFYRKSIEYMQEVQGTPGKPSVEGSKWCAGCHDPAVFLTGNWDTPIVTQMQQAETDERVRKRLTAGLGCNMCHAAVHVSDTMGQAGLVLEYPVLHRYAISPSPFIKWAHNALTVLDPGPHRNLFLKPFHTQATAEFCSGCHKVHLDKPFNHYRWVRGFDEYDAWQQSGVSGQGVRAFYYPDKFKKCVDCHMPLVKSNDRGNLHGFVHSHRFPAANTALPFVNDHPEQLEAAKKMLTNNVLSIDIFALRRQGGGGETQPHSGSSAGSSTGSMLEAQAIAPGEGSIASGTGISRPHELSAPIDRVDPLVRRGETVSIDVVVRTRGVGHVFPGGTMDAFDVWVEMKAVDSRGRVLLWSGKTQDGGHGPVDPGAHFYRTRLLDAHGNVIDKRNAASARAVLYARAIPPGAADVVHYRLHVPKDCGDRITLSAKVNYRKFSWFYTQFAYAGRPDPTQGGSYSVHFDDRKFIFDGDTSKVSGKIKRVPNLPIIVMAETKQPVVLRVGSAFVFRPQPREQVRREDWERWNDYGIGLLLQRDFQGAERAFTNVTRARPEYVDGYVHLGRAFLEDGDIPAALKHLGYAVAQRPGLGKANYFYALALRKAGRYADAIRYLEQAREAFPTDRNILSDLGQLLVDAERFEEAREVLQQALAIDPEHVPAHYNLMRCYGGLATRTTRLKEARAAKIWFPAERARFVAAMDQTIREYRELSDRYRRAFERFKVDPTTTHIAGRRREVDPYENRESLLVHEHN
ncbi:MAG: tetratricopeptide repeat protein [Armatimonadetes bacterium]|nr:tetratricopeptide repeat protein [Armatimonadota bacterium]